MAVALGTLTGLVLEGQYQGSDFQRQYLNWCTAIHTDSTARAANVLQKNAAGVIGYIELTLFWFVVGLATCALASAIYRTVRSANQARASLYYLHVSRTVFLRELYARLALRGATLAVWFGYSVLTLHILLPYALGAIHVADEHFPSIGAIVLEIGAVCGLSLTLHLHIVLVRLFMLRPRIFHDEDYAVPASAK